MTTVMSLARGTDIWYGMKAAAVPFLEERATAPGFDPFAVILGLALHLGISVAWAIPFALIAYGKSAWGTMLRGLIWSFVVWIGMYYLVLPMAGLGAMAREAPIGGVIAYHLFFGLSLAAAFLPFQGRAPREWTTIEARPSRSSLA